MEDVDELGTVHGIRGCESTAWEDAELKKLRNGAILSHPWRDRAAEIVIIFCYLREIEGRASGQGVADRRKEGRGGWTRSHDSPRDQILRMGIPYETLFSQSSCLRPMKVISFESTCLVVSEQPAQPPSTLGYPGSYAAFFHFY